MQGSYRGFVLCEVFVLPFGILNCGFEEYLVQAVDLGFGEWLVYLFV
jgi:hypothetical protein